MNKRIRTALMGLTVGIIEACDSTGTIGYYTDITQILSTWTSTITTG
jgi:hypothetical protein